MRTFLMLVVAAGGAMAAENAPGIFTQAQADAGRTAYESTCGKCHTYAVTGRKGEPGELPPLDSLSAEYQGFVKKYGKRVPPLKGDTFLNHSAEHKAHGDGWGAHTTAELIKRFQEAVGPFPPDGADNETATNITAYILRVNGANAGTERLTKTTAVVINSLIAGAGNPKPAATPAEGEESASGMFTQAQVDAGRALAEVTCSQCHTLALTGRKGQSELPGFSSLSPEFQAFVGKAGIVPPLVGPTFIGHVEPKTIPELVKFLQSALVTFLPERTDEESGLNVTAYVLMKNGLKPGTRPLTMSNTALVRSLFFAPAAAGQ